MLDLKPVIHKVLKDALGKTPVYYFYPPIGGALPCVSWYEAENRRETQADAVEYLSAIVFVIDVWGRSAYDNGAIGQSIDTAMTAAGFKRAFSCDLYEAETKIHHKTMRYRALVAADGKIYQ